MKERQTLFEVIRKNRVDKILKKRKGCNAQQKRMCENKLNEKEK
jgi:hypothetical protein